MNKKILITCPDCGKNRYLLESNVRHNKSNGLFTGRCRSCYMKKQSYHTSGKGSFERTKPVLS